MYPCTLTRLQLPYLVHDRGAVQQSTLPTETEAAWSSGDILPASLQARHLESEKSDDGPGQFTDTTKTAQDRQVSNSVCKNWVLFIVAVLNNRWA